MKRNRWLKLFTFAVLCSVLLIVSPAELVMAQTNSVSSGNNASHLTLTQTGSTVTLSNSKISVTINKNTGGITSMKDSAGKDLLQNGGVGYFLANYSIGSINYAFGPNGSPYGKKMVTVKYTDSGAVTLALSSLKFRVVKDNGKEIVISESVDNPKILPFSLDMRFVLRRNSPGIYTYEIYGYSKQDPSGLHIGQTRYALRVSPKFTQYALSNSRKGTLPTPQELANSQHVTNATELLPNGKVYTKYSYSQYQSKTHVYGFYGDGNTGISFVTPHEDYIGGGPTRQDLTLQQTNTTPILLWQPVSSHYGAPGVSPEYGWSKIYGPIFMYINHAKSLKSMWANDQVVAKKESLKWPYQWLTQPLYQASSRGKVVGHLKIEGLKSPIKNGWVVLGNGTQDWQLQSLNYESYAPLSPSGSFKISGVRPGTYTLYAIAKGVPGEFKLGNVTVHANHVTSTGVHTWKQPEYGKTLWQIGQPSRSSAQFRNGKDHYQFTDFLRYPLDFPNGVNYYVGKSDYRTDWNYVQPALQRPGSSFELKQFDHLSPSDQPTNWKIHFNQKNVLSGTATLTIGIASDCFSTLDVFLNGTPIKTYEKLPGPINDNAMYRQGDQGIYRQLEIQFPASLMKKGENVLSLKVKALSNPSAAGIMYSFLKLQASSPKS